VKLLNSSKDNAANIIL